MKDGYGREIEYLRISVTDRCNLRCKYCMPDGIKWIPMEEILSFEEIEAVVRCGARLGLKSVRLTGGEPLTRRGIEDLVKMIKDTEGIGRVSITTNGVLLKEKLPELLSAGLDAVNISLDTLNRERYKEITGCDALGSVLEVIDEAVNSGIRTKINVVSLGSVEEELLSITSLAKDRALDVRFIEMMPIGRGKSSSYFDHRSLLFKLKELYPELIMDMEPHGSGPAVYFKIPGFKGSIGLISSIHFKFCDSCNRVRLTSRGVLKLCLCYEDGTDLREILRSGLPDREKEEKLTQAIRDAILRKPRFHSFENAADITESAFMNGIGG